jgi:WhiB family redox-sensing transcriptional regulator
MGVSDAATRSAWKQAAACLGSTSQVFYPDTEEATATAKALCAQCRVRDICLEMALRNNEKYGVWGGLTPRERARLRRRRALRVA